MATAIQTRTLPYAHTGSVTFSQIDPLNNAAAVFGLTATVSEYADTYSYEVAPSSFTVVASGQVQADKYLAAYGDVRAAGIDPLLHYVDFGQSEIRTAFAA